MSGPEWDPDPESDPDPLVRIVDPDPRQNVMDPLHPGSVLYLWCISYSAMSQRAFNRNTAVYNTRTLMRINKKAEYFFCKFFTRFLDKR